MDLCQMDKDLCPVSIKDRAYCFMHSEKKKQKWHSTQNTGKIKETQAKVSLATKGRFWQEGFAVLLKIDICIS